MSSSTYKAPGFFPGVLEIVFYILFLAVSGMFLEAKNGDDVIIMGGIALIVMGVGFFLLKRRHKKRAETFPDHPPVVRIRDLAMFGMVGLFAQHGGALFSKAPQVQETGVIIAGLGLIGLIFTSVMWGKLCGGKSMLWGAFFCISGALGLYMAFKSLSPLGSAMDGLENAGFNTAMLLASLVLMVAGYALQGVASIFGGLALFKELAERANEEFKLMSFMRWAYLALGVGAVLGALAMIPENNPSDDVVMRVAITPSTMMALLMIFAGRGMTKHLKATAGGADAPVAVVDSVEPAPEAAAVSEASDDAQSDTGQ